MNLTRSARVALGAPILAVFVGAACTLSCLNSPVNGDTPDVALQTSDADAIQERITKAMAAAPQRLAGGPGLIGARGGAHLKLLRDGAQEVLLPIPQSVSAHVPIVFAISTNPPEAATAYRLHKRDDANVALRVTLNGSPEQDVQITWAAVVLVADSTEKPGAGAPDEYRAETACVQSRAEQITVLANDLWPENASAPEFAASIQKYIHDLKQERPPRSLDALDLLDSKVNWICTANANLAAALLRAKGIPTRSLAVIPTTGQRLEMHRVAEFYVEEQWSRFDPSGLHQEIPMKPWHSIVMATTTIADENVAMKPRMGVSLGAPYGHELELQDNGITFTGADFFWTEAKPLAEFEVSADALKQARAHWQTFLSAGKLSPAQISAASATTEAGLLDALNSP